ncbi:MAG: CopD family protein [Bacteroidia bacterium]|nr:CopD family protein [Bacteroidia bacterium]
MSYIIALHVIFMVSWFAALFYMPRLLIYHREAQDRPEPDRGILSTQLKLMQRRLWHIIAWPGMALTWIFGLWAAFIPSRFPYPWNEVWFILKFIFVLALTLYHLQTHFIFRQMQNNIFRWTSTRLRLWNEVATLLLFVIVFLVIPKRNDGWVWALLALVVTGLAIYAGVFFYRRHRRAAEQAEAVNEQKPPSAPQQTDQTDQL